LRAGQLPSASEEEFMAKVRATVQGVGDKHYLDIELESDTVRIPMSDDNPNHVKSAFNRLIERAKSGEFTVELDKIGDDLFSQVANEYVGQLNREIKEVRAEMKQLNLLGDKQR
jgi:methyl-accepting chemotaxis protein